MIRKFFVQILLIAVIVCFFGLNFETKVNIKFWFNDQLTLNNISLFVSLAAAYLLGVLTSIPFYIARGMKNKNKEKNRGIEKTTEDNE